MNRCLFSLFTEISLVCVFVCVDQHALTHSARGKWSELEVDWVLSTLAATSIQFRYVVVVIVVVVEMNIIKVALSHCYCKITVQC